MHSSTEFNPNATSSKLAYVLVSSVAAAATWATPTILGLYVDFLGFEIEQAGYLISIEMLGYALGATAVFLSVSRINWRYLALSGFVLFIAGNLLSILLRDYLSLSVVRSLSGLGGGISMTMVILSVSLIREPDRTYGLVTLAQLLMGAITIYVLTSLIPELGFAAPFMFFTAMAVAVVWLIRYFPADNSSRESRSTISTDSGFAYPGVTGLIGVLVLYGGLAGVWAFTERFGVESGFSQQEVGNSIGLAMFSGMAAAMLATIVGNRLGRILPLLLTSVVSCLAVFNLVNLSSISQFVIVVCALNFSYVLCAPYMQAIIADLDRTGRLIAALGIVFPLSFGLGPAALSSIMAVSGNSQSAIIPAFIFSSVIGFVLLATVAWRSQQDPHVLPVVDSRRDA